MRLGGPVFAKTDSPESWAKTVSSTGYKAAYCPIGPEADNDVVVAYAAAARKADIVIAKVGAWSNPISPDAAMAQAALEKCKASLALADRIGARCCVNI
jgi:sugar phosphate isomerase/epimerase